MASHEHHESTSISDGMGLANEVPQDKVAALFPSLGQGWEMDFVMIYLDYVWPFLFPFYRPPLVGTSRAWTLASLQQSRAVFHSVLSLSSFFFTFGLKDCLSRQAKHVQVVHLGPSGQGIRHIFRDDAEGSGRHQ